MIRWTDEPAANIFTGRIGNPRLELLGPLARAVAIDGHQRTGLANTRHPRASGDYIHHVFLLD